MANRSSALRNSTVKSEQTIQELIRGDETDAELDQIIADLLAREARDANASAGSSSVR
jgi:hypothetical protein